MATLQRSPSHSQEHLPAPAAQLPLPTGPLGIVRGLRGRTSEDRDFLSDAFKVKAGGSGATALYRCLAYYASLTERRVAYPSQSTMATYCDISDRQVRRLLPKLVSDGLIVCVARKGGRAPSTFQLAQRGHNVRFNVDNMSDKEGRDQRTKDPSLSVSADAQTIDPSTESKADNPSLFPSQEKAKTRALGPEKPVVVFSFPNVVRKWFKVMRRLGRYCDDTMAMAFDKKPHREKTVEINDLEAVEQEQVYQGRLSAPPVTRPKGFLTAAAEEDQRLAACEHVPADDLPVNCARCGSYIGGA